jgi:SAM-dependent methyltransferase
MSDDPYSDFKRRQREAWTSFTLAATFTVPVAAHLVRFAGIRPGESVLDVGTGTGVVAVTAARTGARVSALDLTPELLVEARENGRIAGHPEISWQEGDAEQLPYPDAAFDVVVSQYGHMFAPRPQVAVAEMRRVLKPSGRVAFATWPPEHLVGRMFALIARYSPPPPPGAAPPPLWGNTAIVAERLAGAFGEPFFERGTMAYPALSLAHYRRFIEATIGPMRKVIEGLANEPERLAQVRADFDALATPYYADNQIQQSYLLTRAAVR